MSPFDFDQVINRRTIPNISKWTYYPEEVLPLWVADMDFLTPEPVRAALRRTLDHGILGYELPGQPLLESVAARMEQLYHWKIAPEMVLPVPGVGIGLSAAIRALTAPGDGILVQPPIFPPFLQIPELLGRLPLQANLRRTQTEGHWVYQSDPAALEAVISADPGRTKALLLCNPHNPTGRTFTQDELAQIAGACLRHELLIFSDEIHHGIQLNDREHIPVASLSAEIGRHTLTFIGPGKTFNMSGLHCAFAIVPDAALRQKLTEELVRSVIEVNSLGLAAAGAAYSGACDEWLFALRQYLRSNRDFALDFIKTEIPELRTTIPESTYLLWMDCSELILSGKMKGAPQPFLIQQAKLALTDGEEFGHGGEGFVRLNFACPRSVLEEGLIRMKKALG